MSGGGQLESALHQFWGMPYPRGIAGLNVCAVELVLMDPDIVSAVERVIAGHSDSALVEELCRLEMRGRMVTQVLTGESRDYYQRATDLSTVAISHFKRAASAACDLVNTVIACPTVQPLNDRDLRAINDRACGGDTPLTAAARMGRDEWCKALIAHGAVTGLEDEVGLNPLALGAISGDVPVIRTLLEAGAGPNDHGTAGMPALWWAVYSRQPEAVSLLLGAGADPLAADVMENDLLEYAAGQELSEIADLVAVARAAR